MRLQATAGLRLCSMLYALGPPCLSTNVRPLHMRPAISIAIVVLLLGAFAHCLVRYSATRRFIITVLIATVLHAVACILAPPFEFGHSRAECFFYAFVSGLMAFPI